jgi:adenylate cyclase
MVGSARLAILFADIAGSTRLYDTLGDGPAREITSKCIDLMSDVTARHGGRVVKTIGDEVMCTFATADDAARAAVEMQEVITDHGMQTSVPLAIRVGFHFGKVIEDGGDVFGDAVNVAARMGGQAKAAQIITTGDSLAAMNGPLADKSRLLQTTTVKGKKRPLEIHELTWGQEEELTMMARVFVPPDELEQAPKLGLRATYAGREMVIGPDRTMLSMGRGGGNHFVIEDTMASRSHGKLELRRGRFFFVDQSTNGSYVTTEDGRSTFVHRDELALEGQGIIGIGRCLEMGDTAGVSFVIEG